MEELKKENRALMIENGALKGVLDFKKKQLARLNTDYIELKGCYNMDTNILHKEIADLKKDIRLSREVIENFSEDS